MDNKKDDLLSIQWQTCVDMANSVSQRRDTMNNLFVTLNLAIIAGISLVGGTKTIMMIVAGVIVCAVWILFINNFKELNSAKFAIINTLEESMINKPFTEEWRIIKDNPIHSARSMADLKESIRNKMFFASHVVILAGVYATYSKWINIEVELAKEMGKKIIAVEPWGAEHTSKFVKDSADVIVKWQTASIVSAIRGY